MSGFTRFAEGGAEDSPLPPQLIAGDTPAMVTEDIPVPASVDWPQYTVLQRNGTTGAYETWAAGNDVAGITAYPTKSGREVRAAIYTAGMFNIDALLWPSGTTEVQAQEGCRGLIRCRKLLYSDKRTGQEQLGLPAGPSLLTILPSSGALPNFTDDEAVAAFMSAPNANGAVTYSLYSGTLPTGMTVNSANGLQGTPTAAGDYTFSIKAVDSQGMAGVVNYTVTVDA